MSFASNANYASPVVAPDLGNATKVIPPDLANGFIPEQPMAAEHVNYCINKLCPLRAKFTSNGTWTKPQGATTVRIVCVGGGGRGGTGTASQGALGGEGGEVIEMTFDADELGSTLDVVVGAAGAPTAGASYVQSGGLTLVCAQGGADGNGFGASGVPVDFVTTVQGVTLGGVGGAAAAGSRGNHSRYGGGGAGGATNTVGSPGRGYGAGGGGGRQASGSNSGGGGGGGGYGTASYAGNASGSTGGNGAPGVVYIFTSCDIV